MQVGLLLTGVQMAPGLLFGVITARTDPGTEGAGKGCIFGVLQVNIYPGRILFGIDSPYIPGRSKIQQFLIKGFSFHGSFPKDLPRTRLHSNQG